MTTTLITGANRGIGLALVKACAKRGDYVIAGCRHPAAAADLQALARSMDGAIRVVQIDVTDPATIEAAAAEVIGEPIDILINNAAVIDPRTNSALDVDFDAWAHAFDVNTMGPLRVVRGFLANLRQAGQSKVATISSRMSLGTSSDHLAYRTTKLAVNRAMQALAGDLRSDRITVILIHPGWVRTAMGGPSASLTPEKSAQRITELIDRTNHRASGQFFDIDGSQVAC